MHTRFTFAAMLFASKIAAMRVDKTRWRKRLLISDEVASLPAKKIDRTSKKGNIDNSSQTSAK